MPNYQLKLAPAAVRQLNKLAKLIQQKIFRRCELLELNPRPMDCKKLSGSDSFYRIRMGDYRIIYTIQDKELLILIVKIAHRKHIYRNI